ncbi:MAG: NAD(P)H-hydrate dehydratase [Rhodobacteraceae bacterium]|nr:NAD(P)H-hydrate dehydratase [Paracoccaceae bacterium]
MTELLTAAGMRALEAGAIARGRVTGLELMERAGRGVVEAIGAAWPERGGGGLPAPRTPREYFGQDEGGRAARAVVLCGPGNNGGDGFVVARLLGGAGWDVAVLLYGDPARLPPDARTNLARWQAMGEVVALGFPDLSAEGIAALRRAWGRDDPVDLVVDAIFGTGLARPADALGALFDHARELREAAGTRVVAVDVPTGLCADSGRLYPPGPLQRGPEAVIRADLTVTFHRPRIGHHLGEGPACCGRLAVADIGLEGEADGDGPAAAAAVRLLPPEGGVPALARSGRGHKYSHGHALILAGPPGHGGAARLAARGALRIGAGLVTVGAPAGAMAEHAAQLNAVMLREIGTGAALEAALAADGRIGALCIGPGLGVDARGRGLVAAALAGRRACVLDADALTLVAREPALRAALHGGCVLTPHAGEFARLFPDIAARLEAPPARGPAFSKVDAARAAAAGAGCVVLLKGADTVIAGPEGRAAVSSAAYDRAAPWLATAGSGDVLAGFVAGLLARGFAPAAAAETAAWLHVDCALAFGPGLIAEDLPEMLPRVFGRLGL